MWIWNLAKIVFGVFILSFITGCDGYTVKGTLKFDGSEINRISPVEPKFWFRNEDRNIVVTPRIKYKKGQLRIYDLPAGNYGMSVDVDANLGNPGMYPGDFRAWTQFNVTERNKTHLNVDLTRIMHLISPQDNGAVMRYWDAECDEKIAIANPVVFSWEPVETGVYYDYYIEKTSCNPYKTLDTIIGATTQDSSVAVQLPESAPNEFYQFHLTARKNGKIIGTLMTHGGNGYGWDYRFRVR